MPVKEADSHREVVETLLKLMGAKVQQILQSGGIGTPADVVGLMNVGRYISQHLQLLAGDKSEKQRVKAYGDALGKLGNEIKGIAQRQQEAAAKQNGHQIEPETQAKIQGLIATTKAKIASKRVADSQKLQQKDAQFRQKMQHENVKLAGDMFAQGVHSTVEAHAKARAAAFSGDHK